MPPSTTQRAVIDAISDGSMLYDDFKPQLLKLLSQHAQDPSIASFMRDIATSQLVDARDVPRYVETLPDSSDDNEGCQAGTFAKDCISRTADGFAVNAALQLGTRVARYAECAKCASKFDVQDNAPGACMYHTGQAEEDWDSDVWTDHDDRCHAPPDINEFPQAYMYGCCGNDGSNVGCIEGMHVAKGPNNSGRKRARK